MRRSPRVCRLILTFDAVQFLPKVVKALVAAGADANHGFEIEGGITTALTAAVPKGIPEIITALIDGGANINGHEASVSGKPF